MCGSDEPPLYHIRSFTYHTEQGMVNEVQRIIVYNATFLKVIQNNFLDLSKRVNNSSI